MPKYVIERKVQGVGHSTQEEMKKNGASVQ